MMAGVSRFIMACYLLTLFSNVDLRKFEKRSNRKKPETATTDTGSPFDNLESSLTVGANGPVLLRDTNFLEMLQHFTRERVPERVAHANGAGARGFFEPKLKPNGADSGTKYMSDISKAALFKNRKTEIVLRQSTTGGALGSADTIRDLRGFAVKFKTTEGNFDLLTLSLPVFFINDATLLPSLLHCQKEDPVSGLTNPNMFWDFVGQRPEGLNTVIRLLSYLGIPNGYLYMDGFSITTFQFTDDEGNPRFGRFFFESNQTPPDGSSRFLSSSEAAKLAGTDPHYARAGLYNAIKSGKPPSWTLKVQVRTEPADSVPDSAFDTTREWTDNFEIIEAGTITLDKNPTSFFGEVEQVAFNPANLVPGITAAPKDRLFQGRLFVYGDTHMYRIGTNHGQLPVNCPLAGVRVNNYARDGSMNFEPQGFPNYFPNTYGGPQPDENLKPVEFKVSGTVGRYEDLGWAKDQVADFYNDQDDAEKKAIAKHFAGDLGRVDRKIRDTIINLLKDAGLDKLIKDIKKAIKKQNKGK